ncbi:MAG: S1C family serine protease [Pyrinomonadaceae bacterium]
MSQKAVYRLSARQILLVAFASALMAVGIVIGLSNFGGIFQARNSANVALAENAPKNISDPSAVSDEQNSIEVYRSLSPGVAFVSTTSYSQDFWGDVEEGKGTGSGSVIDARGYILTNNHVVEDAQKLTVSFGGDKVYPAKVVGRDADTDLAVIKIDPPAGGLTVVPFGDSDSLSVGQKVLAIGNPFGLDRTMTTGIISGLQRPIRARNNRVIEGAIQTDASINPGNSGGPLLDKYGKMIGINSQILAPAGGSVGVGFAIPVSIAKRVVPQLIQFGEVRRPTLGIGTPYSVKQLSESGYQFPVESGLLIRSLLPNGAAARAGLRGLSRDASGDVVLGDIITAINGEKIDDLDDFYNFLDKHQIGETVQVEIFRDNRKMTIPVKLTSSSSQQQPTRTGGRISE